MTREQQSAITTLVDMLKSGSWMRPPVNPQTLERARGPEIEMPDGSRVFALRRADKKIHWYVYGSDGRQVANGIAQ